MQGEIPQRQREAVDVQCLGLEVEIHPGLQIHARAQRRLAALQIERKLDIDRLARGDFAGLEVEVVHGVLRAVLLIFPGDVRLADIDLVDADAADAGLLAGGGFLGGLFRRGRLDQVVPVGSARGVAREVEFQAVEKNGVDNHLLAQQRQQFHFGAGGVDARKGLGAEAGRVAQLELAGLNTDPGKKRPAELSLDTQFPAGLVLDRRADFPLVLVGIEDQCQGDGKYDEQGKQATDQDGQNFQGFFQGGASGEMERVMGIEPTLLAWEARVLPLNYTRVR